MEDYGEHTTGTRDEHYNLVSILYHTLQGANTCDHYAMDVEAAGDAQHWLKGRSPKTWGRGK